MPSQTLTYSVRVHPLAQEFAAPADATVLQSARAAGVVLPSSCRNGTCRACVCQLLDGRVDYTVPWPGLSAEEHAQGCVLPCVALPRTDLVLRCDRARLAQEPE